jgi:hypothetical protein
MTKTDQVQVDKINKPRQEQSQDKRNHYNLFLVTDRCD